MADLGDDRYKCEPFGSITERTPNEHRGIARPVRCEAACYGAGQTDVWFDVILRPHVRIQVYSTVPYLVRY
jgi:hypothetical protein